MMKQNMPPIPPFLTRTVVFFEHYWKVLLFGLLSAGALLVVISQFLPQQRFTHLLLERYAGTDIRVGDNTSVVQQLGEQVTRDEDGPVTTATYKSTKNPNLFLKFSAERNHIIEAHFPVTLEESVSLPNVALPTDPYREYWDEQRPGVVVRAYPTLGVGLSYHFATFSVSEVFQFRPNEFEAFVIRNEGLTPRANELPPVDDHPEGPARSDDFDYTIDTAEEAALPATASSTAR